MATSSVLARVAPPGEIIGLGRKEAIFDSDVEPTTGPVGDLAWFQDFQDFSNAAAVPFKKSKGGGVFTNLKGSGTGAPLPAGYKFGGYRSRLTLTTYDEDPTLLANAAFWADKRMLRMMGYVKIKTDQSDYMTMRFSQLVNWEENERIAVSQGANGGFIALCTPGTDYAGRALDVGQQPLVFESLQSWHSDGIVPVARTAAPNFTPVLPIVAVKCFDGVLVRPTG